MRDAIPTTVRCAVLAALTCAAVAGASDLVLEPCELPGIAVPARCGTYDVFENRDTRSGRTLSLRVVVLPATGPDRAPDPVVSFAGGPGASTVEQAQGIAAFYAGVLAKRDFLLVDYRGTGESEPLFCPYQQEERGVEEVLESFIAVDRIPECRELLSADHDLTQYTTDRIVDDVDEVRRALGYEKVNLIGGSYGSRAALVYLRRHPDAVRTVDIEGIVPTDARMPVTFARDAQTALDGWFAECAADEACATAFPDPAGDLQTVLERLEAEPPTVDVTDPRSGETVSLTLSRNAFVQALRYLLYTSINALKIPAYLHAAAAGEWEPMAQATYTVAGLLLTSIPDGLYLSVTCAEDVNAIGPNAAAVQAGTFLGDFRLRQQRDACAAWTSAEMPASFREPIVSDAPVLILSGERDPVTPARSGYQVQEFLTGSAHLVVPDGGHGWFGLTGTECIHDLEQRFLETADAQDLDLEACRRAIGRPSFLLEIPNEEPVELTAEQLARYAGTYSAEGGAFRTDFAVVDGELQATFAGETLHFVPIGDGRFKIPGEPAGDHYRFVEEDGRVTAFEIVKGGSTQVTLDRDDG